MTEIIKGMDISSIIEEEQCGARYYDGGKEGSLLEILKRYRNNSVRIRIWNNRILMTAASTVPEPMTLQEHWLSENAQNSRVFTAS